MVSLFKKKRIRSDQVPIILVSGLPRSGTSMMMRMIAAGGIEIITDQKRKADPDNPAGYFEFEKAKQLDQESDWLEDARGKAVKVISMLLYGLPRGYAYKVIFMQRKMDEILASQKKMLERRGEPPGRASDRELSKKFNTHLHKVLAWLAEQQNMETLVVRYNDVISDAHKEARRIARFLDDVPVVDKMVEAVDRRLYRQRF